MSEIPAEAVEAAYTVLLENGWQPPYMAHARDYVPDLAALKAADKTADENNRKSLRRALAAALSGRAADTEGRDE